MTSGISNPPSATRGHWLTIFGWSAFFIFLASLTVLSGATVIAAHAHHAEKSERDVVVPGGIAG